MIMNTKPTYYLALVLALLLRVSTAYPQALTGYTFKIVDMIPNAQSNETGNDAETNIAVNPANTLMIAGSAFTMNPTGGSSTAPIYITTNGGTTWSLNNIVPSGNGVTGDISMGFGSSSGTLYTGILKGGSGLHSLLLRTTTPTASTLMTTLIDRGSTQIDQPFVSAITANDASSVPRDRLFAGDNLYQNKKGFGGDGKTAEIMVSNDAGGAPPAGLFNQVIEVRSTFEQDMPAIRTAIHKSGVVYAVFYSWQSGNPPSSERCDVVVVRDNNFATGATNFQALLDAGDSKAGQRVVTNRLVPAFGSSLGTNRLVASNLAIAVDPNNPATVYIGWCDRIGTTDYTLHFRRSFDSGQTWGTSDWLTITNATNPGIAVTTDGKVGLIYQQLTGSGSTQQWETHFRTTSLTGTLFTNDILSQFLDSDLSLGTVFNGFLGDYLDIESVGNNFYGVFPAGNRPVNSNFPHSVTYQRNADFTTNNLRNLANTGNVGVSVDPFFFKITKNFIIQNICQLHPEICKLQLISSKYCHFPPYPCGLCPWPCFECPPFEIPIEDIYEEYYKDVRPETILKNPYFHLMLDGFDTRDYSIVIATKDGEPILQTLNKTEKGYAISFRGTKETYNAKVGLHDLKLMALPKTAAAAKKGADFPFRLQASDYRFKEFMTQKR
jgi:hypothetical protein